MHPLFEKADGLSREVIGAALEVHRHMGAGLIESIYERCLLRELELRSIPPASPRRSFESNTRAPPLTSRSASTF
jgi:hypothetical protein